MFRRFWRTARSKLPLVVSCSCLPLTRPLQFGIPQGLIIRPLLYVLYTAELGNTCINMPRLNKVFYGASEGVPGQNGDKPKRRKSKPQQETVVLCEACKQLLIYVNFFQFSSFWTWSFELTLSTISPVVLIFLESTRAAYECQERIRWNVHN